MTRIFSDEQIMVRVAMLRQHGFTWKRISEETGISVSACVHAYEEWQADQAKERGSSEKQSHMLFIFSNEDFADFLVEKLRGGWIIVDTGEDLGALKMFEAEVYPPDTPANDGFEILHHWGIRVHGVVFLAKKVDALRQFLQKHCVNLSDVKWNELICIGISKATLEGTAPLSHHYLETAEQIQALVEILSTEDS